MVKKMYAFAVVRFLLTAVFVNDKPDFPKTSETEILSEKLSAQHIPNYKESRTDTEYYRVNNTVNVRFDRYYTTLVYEVVCGITPDEIGENKIIETEEAVIYGGIKDMELKEITNFSDINPQFTFAHYMGRFVKTAKVSRLPLLKILPGKFIKDIRLDGEWYFYSDYINISLRLYPNEIIELAALEQ